MPPLYEFRCTEGHVTEHRVKLDRSDAPTGCPKAVEFDRVDAALVTEACGAPLERVLSAPASVFPGASSWRR